jgi:hypothetical protein
VVGEVVLILYTQNNCNNVHLMGALRKIMFTQNNLVPTSSYAAVFLPLLSGDVHFSFWARLLYSWLGSRDRPPLELQSNTSRAFEVAHLIIFSSRAPPLPGATVAYSKPWPPPPPPRCRLSPRHRPCLLCSPRARGPFASTLPSHYPPSRVPGPPPPPVLTPPTSGTNTFTFSMLVMWFCWVGSMGGGVTCSRKCFCDSLV